MEVVGYTYDADMHCVKCTMDYARAVEYKDYDWQGYSDEDIEVEHSPGILDMEKAIELEIIKDSENNPIHPIFDTDEAGDSPDHCGDCHEYLDTSWTSDTMDYAVESLREYIKGRMDNAEHPGAKEVLDIWCGKLEWTHGMETHQELIVELYKVTRAFERGE